MKRGKKYTDAAKNIDRAVQYEDVYKRQVLCRGFFESIY